MAKNVTLMGASYSDVPAVNLPQTGGGTARFTDTSGTTATAADVAQGKVFYAADGAETTGTASGGGDSALIITFSQNSTTGYWEPDKTFAEIQTAYNAGMDIVLASSNVDGPFVSGNYDGEDETLYYHITWYDLNTYKSYSWYYYFDVDGTHDDDGTELINLPTGTKSITITENGTTTEEVTNYASAEITVNVSGGGSAIIEPLSVTANGTYTAPSGVDGYSPVVVNVPTGGGASNVVQGTFNLNADGGQQKSIDIDIPYTGNGYPVAIQIFPSEGAFSYTGPFYNLIDRYAIASYSAVKAQAEVPPTYGASGNENKAYVLTGYKSTASSATSAAANAKNNAIIFNNTAAEITVGLTVKFRSSKKMSVMVGHYNSLVAFHFAEDIEYTYIIIYSE